MTDKIKVSSSQVDTAKSCARRWYFKSVMRLPEEKSKNTILGDVGHAVCERWYEEEDMYPKDWHKSINRWTGRLTGDEINQAEQALVQVLVEQAVNDGVLVKHPEGEVEKELRFKAFEFEGVQVTFGGFIDYFSAPSSRIEDHKFCKSFRYYSAAKLSKAIAMNAYAYASYVEGWIPKDQTIWLRYNLFRKDPKAPKIKPVEVEVSWESVSAYWEKEIVPAVKDMVLYKKNAESYNDVPCADDRKNACRAYGKLCDFFDICEGRETPEQYKARKDGSVVNNRQEEYQAVLNGITLNKPKETQMEQGFNALINGAGRAPQAQAPQAQAPQAQAPQAPEKKRMPWHYEGCPACAENEVLGMASNGTPCSICNTLQIQQEGGITSSMFDISVVDGKYVAVPKAQPSAPAVTAEVVPEAQTATESVQPMEASPGIQPKAPEAVRPPVPEQKEQEPVAQAPQVRLPTIEAKGEPEHRSTAVGMTDIDRASFTEQHYDADIGNFSIAFTPVSNRKQRVSKKLGETGHVVRFGNFAEAVFKEIIRVYNEEHPTVPIGSFYHLDVWSRREAIKMNAAVWGEMLGNSTVECIICPEGDAKVLMEALEPRAQVIYGQPV